MMDSCGILSLINIPELSKSHVIIRKPELLYHKLKLMRDHGKNRLQVVLDFDRTMTRSDVYKGKHMGTFEILHGLTEVTETFMDKLKMYMPKYVEGSVNHKLPFEKRFEMVDSAYKGFESILHLVALPDNKIFSDKTKVGTYKLRDRLEKGFKLLKDNSVPVTIISAGCGDAIDGILEVNNIQSDNIKVFANYLLFKDGHIEKFADDIIHLFNKNNAFLKSEGFKQISKKNNIIVIGDMISDVSMVAGLPQDCNIVAIGFYNESMFKENIEDFKQAYDIVLCSDESMDVVNAVLRHILTPTQ